MAGEAQPIKSQPLKPEAAWPCSVVQGRQEAGRRLLLAVSHSWDQPTGQRADDVRWARPGAACFVVRHSSG